MFPVGAAAIQGAHALLRGEEEYLPGMRTRVAFETPLVYSEPLSQQLSCRVWLKLENLQRTGSYKIRGAFNNVAHLPPEQRERGLITASAGNHAQGVAAAAKMFGIAGQTTIFVPVGTPKVKQENTRAYGVEVRETGENFDQAREAGYAEARASGRAFIEPFDDWNTIAGQGTVALEIAERLPQCRAIFGPIGGGGLIAGIALAARSELPGATIIGAQAAGSPSMILSLDQGEPTTLPYSPSTQIADGIKVSRPGDRPFAVVDALIGRDRVVAVSDIETVAAAADLMVYAKVIAEGAGAISVAALRDVQAGKVPAVTPFGADDDVVAIVSGGNIDPSFSWRILYEQTVPNLMTVRVAMPDRPGELLRMLVPIAKLNVNIIDVDVNRLDARPRMGERIVEVCVAISNRAQADSLISALNEAGYRVLVSRWQDPAVDAAGNTLPSAYIQAREAVAPESDPAATPTMPVRDAKHSGVDLRIERFRLTDKHGRSRHANTFLTGEDICVEIEIRNAGRVPAPEGIHTAFFASPAAGEIPLEDVVPVLELRHNSFPPRRIPFVYGSYLNGPKRQRFGKERFTLPSTETGRFRAVAVVDVTNMMNLPSERRIAEIEYEVAETLPVRQDAEFEFEGREIPIIVNKRRPLPADYEPADMRAPDVPMPGHWVLKPQAAVALEAMVRSADEQGVRLRLLSGYRSWERQRRLYEESARARGIEVTDRYRARPGHSEHQTGLAVDLGDSRFPETDLEDSFASTPAGFWLGQHAAEFGFHLRYPSGKEGITGFAWEPWHFRFVGKLLAQRLQLESLTLEEYAGVEGGEYLYPYEMEGEHEI